MNNYQLHGLKIESEISIGSIAVFHASPDLKITWAKERIQLPSEDDGDLIQLVKISETYGYKTIKYESHIVIIFSGYGEFYINKSLTTVEAHLYPGIDKEWASMFITGNVISMLLLLRGESVIHASSVKAPSYAIAIVGASGMGKSTLATTLCEQGCNLITDDVLRFDVEQNNDIVCYTGASSTRLRSGAKSLVDGVQSSRVKRTIDNRTSVRMQNPMGEKFQLDVILIPEISHSVRKISLQREKAKDALIQLLSYPRIYGIKSSEIHRQQMQSISKLVASVPVFKASIPMVDNPNPKTGQDLLKLIDAQIINRD